ncbi:MBL fold metallo-hydrolase [Terrisporobacter glycolicus]|uniref:MBL fold metallo-hydrolase n=1 Tax=Terrisporobacter glycolicus TaxID=36841 RepID=UPI003463F9F2
MKITYIHHSSFVVELKNCILLFDYFQGNLPEFNNDKKLYVFASHSHHDHFNDSIFELKKVHPDVTYILSKDINTTKSKNIRLIDSNEKIVIDNLEIETLQSSDLGVAFIVKIENKRIYHGGDLNWWHWEGENSPEENAHAENLFKNSIDKIKGINIDVAFLPLDSRQGNQYYLGFDYFMKNTNTKIAFPMHFWNNYSLVKTFKTSNHALNYKDKILEINHDNEEFRL